MTYFQHWVSYGCAPCGIVWDEDVSDDFDRNEDMTGTKIDGPTKCEDCGSMDVTAVIESIEADGSGMDEHTAAQERKRDQGESR